MQGDAPTLVEILRAVFYPVVGHKVAVGYHLSFHRMGTGDGDLRLRTSVDLDVVEIEMTPIGQVRLKGYIMPVARVAG